LFEYRRPTESWVRANLRRLREFGLLAEIRRAGEPGRGTVALKLRDVAEGWHVLSQIRTADGQSSWIEGLQGRAVPEAEANDYLDRAVDRDPDLWILEIERPARVRLGLRQALSGS